jgi:hypothetical protein
MSTVIVVCLAAVGLNPVDDAAVDQVDLIEVNHFYDDQGRLVFDQIIYYDWDAKHSRYNVRDWRLIKTPAQIPLRNWRDGRYSSEWNDFKQRDGLRRVSAKSVRETWTQHDPELLEREFLPQEKRRELRKIPYPSQPKRTAPPRRTPAVPNSSRSGY